MIRMLIAEDQALVRDALTTLLNFEDDFEVVANVGDGLEALNAAEEMRPDVVILDVEMPKLTGLEVAEQLRVILPACKMILLTTFARAGYLQRAVKAGVHGYLLKDSQVEELAAAVRRVVEGQRIFSPALMVEAMSEENPLTSREIEVLRCAKTGSTTKDIAKHLSLSEGTVRNYLSEAISKLDCASRQEACRRAEEKGWL